MSNTLIIILGVVGAVALLVLVLGMTGSRSFRYSRSTHIAAPPERVFALIEDFHNWHQWSPFEDDPTLQRTFAGAPKGKGAVYEWLGAKMGQGRMEILDAPAPRKVTIDLRFIKPMQQNNMAEFVLTPDGSGTTVTWDMYGPSNFMSRLMQKFISFDKMLGSMFETGLASMKARAEAAA